MSETTKLIFEKETFAINGAAMEVHSQLGCGFLESVYQEAIEYELRFRNIPFEAQPELSISYKEQTLKHKFRPDLLVFGQVVVELKTLDRLGPNEDAQMLNYLKATGLPIGLLLNFGASRLQWRRLLRPHLVIPVVGQT